MWPSCYRRFSQPKRFYSSPNHYQWPLGMGELLMRTKLRKTLPFVVAIFIGTMAAALIAGIAILAAHS
jgi:hypothetical protein